MSAELSSRAVALVDSHPASKEVLEAAQSGPGPLTVLATVDTKLANREGDIVRSLSAEPTMTEVLNLAAELQAPWVIMRRDVTSPEQLLQELIVGAGKADTEQLPGFAVLLVGPGKEQQHKRILVIADRTHGPMSGLLIFAATQVAEFSGAAIDVLVMGGPGEEVNSEDEFDSLAVNREEAFLRAAQERAAAAGLGINWITAEEVPDAAVLVLDHLRRESYDLVVDDVGDLVIGASLRRGISPEEALLPGQVGQLPLVLLTHTDIDVMLVIDEIRVGMINSRMVKLGAAAAAALAFVAGGAITASRGGEQTVNASAAAAETSTQAAETLGELSARTTEIAVAEDRVKQAAATSRSATKTTKPKAPAAPKGGATASDVSKAQAAQAKSKKAKAAAQAELAEAQAAAKAAQEALAAAQEQVERSQREIPAAQEADTQAQLEAEKLASQTTGLALALPGGPTQEDAALATEAAADTQEWLEGAVDRGDEALSDLQAAQEDATAAQKALAKAEQKAADAKTAYQLDKKTTAVYKASFAKSRQSPVKSGQYNLTARFGQSGGLWSSGSHTGLDFAAPSGTNVYAAATGKVVSAGYAGAYGNRIEIQHSDGTVTTYNHLSNIGVSVGDKVQAGDKIGDVGSTGNSTGPHLHFEVERNGTLIDPAGWLGW